VARFAGDRNHEPAEAFGTLLIRPASPSVEWAAPAAIVYGTPLGGAQLKATADVLGAFTYTPDAGTLLRAGNGQTLSVTFRPDDAVNYATGSASVTLDVLKATPAATIAASSSSGVYGEPLTFTARIAGTASIPTGVVEFYDVREMLARTALVSNNGAAEASVPVSSLAVGVHSITARYLGDDNFNPVDAPPVLATIKRGSTTVAVSASPAASVFGQSIVLTASVGLVSPAAGIPTATLRFLDGTTVLGTAPVLIGEGAASGSISVSSLAVGTHVITAEYLGDANFEPGKSAAMSYVVAVARTATAVKASPNPAGFGQPMIVSATVTTTAPGSGTPSGTVDFFDDATLLGSTALGADASASLVVNGLASGTHALSTRYRESASFAGSTSVPVTVTVQPASASTSTSLSSSKNPSAFGEEVTFTVAVAPLSGTGLPTGTVRLYDGSTLLGQPALLLVNGSMRATLKTSRLVVGVHDISAQYSGDGAFSGSVPYAPLLQSVGTTTTNTSTFVGASPNPAPFNSPVALTATIKAPGSKGPSPSGTVRFLADGKEIGTGTVGTSNKTTMATLTNVLLARGYHVIVAQYLGDKSNSPSTSANAVLQVQ
jgi:hypothetical protein